MLHPPAGVRTVARHMWVYMYVYTDRERWKNEAQQLGEHLARNCPVPSDLSPCQSSTSPRVTCPHYLFHSLRQSDGLLQPYCLRVPAAGIRVSCAAESCMRTGQLSRFARDCRRETSDSHLPRRPFSFPAGEHKDFFDSPTANWRRLSHTSNGDCRQSRRFFTVNHRDLIGLGCFDGARHVLVVFLDIQSPFLSDHKLKRP